MKNTVNFKGKSYPDRRIKSLQAASSASLDLRTMEVDTVELTLDVAPVVMGLMTSEMQPIYTADGYRLCVQEPGGFSEWSQTDALTLSRGGSQYGIWFPRTVKPLPGNYVSISATSPLARLTQMEHRGGIYAGTEAGVLIREICGDVPVYVSSVFEHVALYGYLPYVSPSGLTSAVKGSAKDNLLKVLFALNASLRVSADGVLRIENLDASVSSTLDRSRIYRENAARQEDTPITSVTVLEHQYVTGTETSKLFEGTTTAGQIVVFRDPCSNLTADGFTILSSGANWAELSAGTGTLTGTPYIHITREVTRTVSASDVENTVRIEDATLVGITNSSDVADRVAAYYASRTRILVDAAVEFERPGDVVSAWDPIAKLMRQACIEKMSPLDLSQTMKAKLSLLVGFTPWQQVPFEDVRVIITSGSSYTFPADILENTNVEAVLIGGADGGMNGGNGGDGTFNTARKVLPPYGTGSAEAAAGVGGEGGAGGAKGRGGKILRISFSANPNQSVVCSIGQGGAANGGTGGDTTFGSYSSAEGVNNPSGYLDPVTGVVYAADGTDGITGGKGGNGGSTSGGNGANGGNAGSFTGGIGGAGKQSPTTNDDVYIGGSGGSGATGTSNGNNGNAGTWIITNSEFQLNSRGVDGLNGADAAPAAQYGCGGNGGDGGSGGSGAGGGKVNIKKSEYSGNTSLNINWYTNVIRYFGYGGTGGAGSAGAQGCIILYFRKPLN